MIAVTDATILEVVKLILAFLGTVFTGVVGLLMYRMNTKMNETHALVNSAMGTQLEMHAAVSEQLAIATKNPAHIEAAASARVAASAHKLAQAKIDAKK